MDTSYGYFLWILLVVVVVIVVVGGVFAIAFSMTDKHSDEG